MCIFIFDNASMMEPESYALLLRVFRHCENVCIIMVVDIDAKSVPVMPQLAKPQKK